MAGSANILTQQEAEWGVDFIRSEFIRDKRRSNWIGTFLQPHPRDLTKSNSKRKKKDNLIYIIENGLSVTTMPAWKNVLSKAEIKLIAVYINEAFQKQ